MEKISLFKSQVLKTESSNILKEIAEIGLDSILHESPLKHLPYVNVFQSIYKMGKNVRENQEVKKLAAFLYGLNDVSEQEKQSFNEKLGNPKEQSAFYGRLLLLIGKLDEIQKAVIVANIFKLYLLNLITKEEFMRHAHLVESIYIGDLLALHYQYKQVKGMGEPTSEEKALFFDELVQENLLRFGLVTRKTETAIETELNDPTRTHRISPTIVSKTGARLAYIMLYNDESLIAWKTSGLNF